MARSRNCIICGSTSASERCKACYEVLRFVERLTSRQREDYILVVDGSFTMYPKPKGHAQGGAGLVLAREEDEVVIAACATSFLSTSSDDTEFEAVRRGYLWAPLHVVWTDSEAAMRTADLLNIPTEYVRPHMRDPLHNLAHRLANIGRLKEWDKLDKVWIPGEVWP